MCDSTEYLRDLLDKIAKENKLANYDVRIKPTSGDGANYTSQLYLATISNDSKELNLFAKVIIASEKMRSQVPDNIYDIEPFVYNELFRYYRQLEVKYKVPEEHRLNIPQLYGYDLTRGQELLVLEDLSSQGYRVFDRFKSVDWPYAFEAIKEMAKLHALSFAFKQDHPKEFEKAQKTLVNHLDGNEQIQGVIMSVLETALSVVEEDSGHRLQEFIKKKPDFVNILQYLKPLRHTILMHADFRVSNLMHKVDDRGVYHFKVLDYQTMKAGAPVADLLYFIITGTDEEFRAKYYLPLIDHYYTQLSLAMQRLGLNPNEIYSRDDFDIELKMKLPYGIVMATFLLPIVMVEEEGSPILDKDKDLTTFKMAKIGKQCLERINGILNDYIRWKIL